MPEAIRDPDYVRFLYAALAHGAVGFAPFGIDYVAEAPDAPGRPQLREAELQQLATSYRALVPMARELAGWARDGRLSAAIEGVADAPATLDLGGRTARVGFGVAPRGDVKGNASPVGRVLVARLAPGEFIVTGNYANVRFAPAGRAAGRPWEYLTVEEGRYAGGVFRPERIWNGDETGWGLNLGSTPPRCFGSSCPSADA